MFVTDTHPLLWFANKKFSKLSAKVLEVFQKAERDESLIYIPTVVFSRNLLVKFISDNQIFQVCCCLSITNE